MEYLTGETKKTIMTVIIKQERGQDLIEEVDWGQCMFWKLFSEIWTQKSVDILLKGFQ